MNLEELRWFVVLAETEHVTDAAAELNVTQPTLSRALARMERQVGAPLFDRVNRRLRLNAYGQIMLEHARRGIAEMRSAGERIAALRDPDSGTVRLAFLQSMASWFVPELLHRFRVTAPDVRFDLYQAAGRDIVDHLANGQVDLAITAPRPEGPDVRWYGLYVERLCLVVPRGHPLAKRARLRLADAADEPFVMMGHQFGMRRLTDQLFADEGINPQVVFEATEIAMVEAFVAAGFGVGVVPSPRPHRAEPIAVYVPLSNPGARRQVGLAWAHGRTLSPVAERFAAFVRSSD